MSCNLIFLFTKYSGIHIYFIYAIANILFIIQLKHVPSYYVPIKLCRVVVYDKVHHANQ